MRFWGNRRCQVLLVSLVWLCSVCVLYWYVSKDVSAGIKSDIVELLWWTDNVQFKYDEVRPCGFYTCRFSNNRQRLSTSRAVLFYGSNMKAHDFPLPRREQQLWALLHEESPRNVPFAPNDEFLRHFNFTSTFSRYSDMPLTTQYLPQPNDLTQLDYHSSHQNKQIFQFHGGLASIAFLQTDCNTMSGREDYVRELMQHMRVDSYGGCLHNRDLPSDLRDDYLNNLYSPKLLRFLARYKFMLAIENGVCEDYITEKFWRPLMIGVIPVYFGSPSIRDWQPNNKSVIYVNDFPTAGALAAFLQQLSDNDTEYMSYLDHKVYRRVGNQKLLKHLISRIFSNRGDEPSEEHSLFRKFECFVCRKMHLIRKLARPTKRPYDCPVPPVFAPLQHRKEPEYASDWRSMMNLGRCQAKILDEFFRANRAYTKEEFEARLSEMSAKNLCD
ncbi:hypothetical protein KR222_004575 [Zaprionus bogoriensis]|nr:hypothetical protein KR222_004575 [Zaprionus bogoriensis]